MTGKPIYYLVSGLISLCCLSLVYGQNDAVSARKLSVEQGLSSSIVTTILQDSIGFMWIGTGRGLNRYDGYRFETMLEDQVINDLETDTQGNIWISADRGLYIFDIWKKKLVPDSFFSEHSIASVIKTKTGAMLVNDYTRLYLYDRSSAPRQIFDIRTSNDLDTLDWLRIGSMDVDHSGFVWVVAGRDLLVKLDMNGVLQEKYKVPPFFDRTTLFVDKDNLIWYATKYWLFYKKADEKEFHPILRVNRNTFPALPNTSLNLGKPAYPQGFNKLYKDKQGDYWLFTRTDAHHFYKFDMQTTRLHEFTVDVVDFSKGHIPYMDRNNTLWIGTTDGVVLITFEKKQFQHYLYTLPDGSGRSASTRGMAEDRDGTIYIASYEGVFTMNPAKNSLQRIFLKTDGDVMSLSDDRCYQLLDEDSCLWCASESFGLLKYHKNTRIMERYGPTNIWFLGISLLRTSDGRLWMGAIWDLYLLDETKKALIPSRDLGLDFSNHYIRDLHQDKNGDMWLLTNRGLYQTNRTFKRIKAHYTVDGEVGATLSTNDLLAIHEDSQGILWLGTKGQGLNRLDPVTGKVQVFTKESHGLSNNIICSILQADEDHLWMGSYYGLMQFNLHTHEVRNFFEKDGLSHSEFNQSSAFKGSDGRLYFGGIKGINAFDPTAFDESSISPPMLTSFMQYDPVTGKLLDYTSSVQQSHSIHLNYTDKFIVLHFALSDYRNTEDNRYAYKITGIDNEWNELGHQNQLRLNKPPPGDYKIQIRGMGNDGRWSRPLEFSLQVKQAFYKNPWFIIAVVVVILSAIYIVFRLRLQQLKRAKLRLENTVVERTREIASQKEHIEIQATKLRNLDELKSRFFANISHELRTPLTLILGHTENMLRDYVNYESLQAELKIARQNSMHLLRLVEEILDLSRLDAGKLEVHEKPVDLHALLNRVLDVYRSFLHNKNIRFHFLFNLPEQLYVQFDESKVEKIVHNLLSNAIKFTDQEGTITLEVKEIQAADQLLFISIAVIDTGRGIHPKDLPRVFDRFYQSGQTNTPVEGGTGIGLALAKELTNLMGGSLEVKSEWGKGSCFTFCFPKKEVDAKDVVPTDELPVLTTIPETSPKSNQDTFPAYKKQVPIILVVEDHLDMRAFICKLLNPHYKIKEATDGKEALKKLRHHRVDLIVSDVMMPRMDGFALLEALKEKTSWKDLPVIMLTARAAIEDKLHALRIGVNDYLIKPFQREELLVRIGNLLQNRQQRLEWQEKIAREGAHEELLSADERFVQQAEAAVKKELDNARFNVIDLSDALLVSQRQLTRKIRSTTGLSPLQFIREVRLQEARRMLENKEKETVAEVMYAVGIQTGGHFSEIYCKRFGKKPSSYFGKSS